ncbi:serine hydrolase domain-containing protein [Nonomuraea sp. NPDC048826]|uniref:serine hydrolase domain-containing protein n=1 Tax=Nonomuraea sp. NPDC048826 TaxID=3364347 RepID=UPI0037189D96
MKKMQLMTLALGAGLVLAPAAPASASPAELESAAVDAYLTRAWESTALPGMSVVVTYQGKVVHAAGYGRDAAGRPVTERTPMRVASLSKSFTAMAVMTLVEEGKLALDEPVVNRLPDFRMADPRAEEITVRQLLNQTSGISDATVDLGAAESAPSLAGYVAELGSGKLAADPGTRWAYSNANYETAARLVEVAGGRRFGDYLKERVFEPLGMSGSAAGDPAVRPADGFNSLFGVWMARSELRDFPYGGGAGGVVTNAADMGKWLISQTGRGRQLVGAESLAAMHAPSEVHDYGMGWGKQSVNGADMLVHAGNLFTYTAVEAIDPETGYGFAVMTNSAGLYDDTYDVLTGLVAMSQGDTPRVPGGDRQLIEVILGLVVLAAAGLGVLGVRRAGPWAARRAGRSGRRVALRLVPVLLPTVLLALYPATISFLMNGRTITWEQLTYHAAPLTITLVVAAVAGLVTGLARLRAWRSVGSTR